MSSGEKLRMEYAHELNAETTAGLRSRYLQRPGKPYGLQNYPFISFVLRSSTCTYANNMNYLSIFLFTCNAKSWTKICRIDWLTGPGAHFEDHILLSIQKSSNND